MNKAKAIELLKQYLSETEQLRTLHYDNEDFELWDSKIQNVIKAGLDPDDYKTYKSAYPTSIPIRGIAPESALLDYYQNKISKRETAIKKIIQKYELLETETQPTIEELPKATKDYEKKAGKELELVLEGTPDMIIECIMHFVTKLNSEGYAYKCVPRIGDAPDYARWDKTYSARCTIIEAHEGAETQIGIIGLQLLPKERTLFKIPEPEDWESAFGKFISHLVAEFRRLGFIYFEEEKPPIGFRPPHEQKNV